MVVVGQLSVFVRRTYWVWLVITSPVGTGNTATNGLATIVVIRCCTVSGMGRTIGSGHNGTPMGRRHQMHWPNAIT